MSSMFINLRGLCIATAAICVSTSVLAQAVVTPPATAPAPAILARGPSGLVITSADVSADMARLPALGPKQALALLSLPDAIRGYGPVKASAMAAAQTRRLELLNDTGDQNV